jgi:hypothetical protein
MSATPSPYQHRRFSADALQVESNTITGIPNMLEIDGVITLYKAPGVPRESFPLDG